MVRYTGKFDDRITSIENEITALDITLSDTERVTFHLSECQCKPHFCN